LRLSKYAQLENRARISFTVDILASDVDVIPAYEPGILVTVWKVCRTGTIGYLETAYYHYGISILRTKVWRFALLITS
jgi:hypothetical protein